MIRRALGTILLFVLIVGALAGGVIWIAYDVTSLEQFLEVVNAIWAKVQEFIGV